MKPRYLPPGTLTWLRVRWLLLGIAIGIAGAAGLAMYLAAILPPELAYRSPATTVRPVPGPVAPPAPALAMPPCAGQGDTTGGTMSIQPIYKDLWPELAKAACAMVRAHMDNETMVPALDDVAEQYPNLTREQLTCLWMGVNAKAREGLIGA